MGQTCLIHGLREPAVRRPAVAHEDARKIGAEDGDHFLKAAPSASDVLASPRSRVSWQVTGIRQDAFAKAHRTKMEEDKTPQSSVASTCIQNFMVNQRKRVLTGRETQKG